MNQPLKGGMLGSLMAGRLNIWSNQKLGVPNWYPLTTYYLKLAQKSSARSIHWCRIKWQTDPSKKSLMPLKLAILIEHFSDKIKNTGKLFLIKMVHCKPHLAPDFGVSASHHLEGPLPIQTHKASSQRCCQPSRVPQEAALDLGGLGMGGDEHFPAINQIEVVELLQHVSSPP